MTSFKYAGMGTAKFDPNLSAYLKKVSLKINGTDTDLDTISSTDILEIDVDSSDARSLMRHSQKLILIGRS